MSDCKPVLTGAPGCDARKLSRGPSRRSNAYRTGYAAGIAAQAEAIKVQFVPQQLIDALMRSTDAATITLPSLLGLVETKVDIDAGPVLDADGTAQFWVELIALQSGGNQEKASIDITVSFPTFPDRLSKMSWIHDGHLVTALPLGGAA